MKFENTEVWGFEHAIRGMRNPLNSWKKSDSKWKGFCTECNDWVDESCSYDASFNCCDQIKEFFIGENDLALMQKLIKAGSEHRKFMRQIMVSVDITAPLYWWKECDTYKVGTVANSTSTMHKLASTPITMDCFDFDKLSDRVNPMVEVIKKHRLSTIDYLERLRKNYNEIRNQDIKKEIWKVLVEDLPESWLQTRTVTMSYENILSMVNQRKNHKLTEWTIHFMDWAKSLPYADELLFMEEKND